MMRTCAVVVTYNRKDLLRLQLEMLAKQDYMIDAYYIIDNNGSDGTDQMIREISANYPIEIHYIRLDENLGGAGGFYSGLKTAFADSFDWYILMDDDGRPYDQKCFSEVFGVITDNNYSPADPYFLNSLVTEDNVELSFGLGHLDSVKECINKSNNGLYMNVVNPFNGTVISRGLIEKIGYPNGDFFIKGDEVDYYRRALKANAVVATIVSSRYRHPKPQGMDKKVILGREVYIYIEAPWKEYYNVRNHVYTFISLNQSKEAFLFLTNRLVNCIFCKCEKKSTIKMIIRGYKDGKSGKLGPVVKPGEK